MLNEVLFVAGDYHRWKRPSEIHFGAAGDPHRRYFLRWNSSTGLHRIFSQRKRRIGKRLRSWHRLNWKLIGWTRQDELVFANYGSYEDLRYLEEELKINLAGRLLLIRYGSFFRGDKVLNAQRFGAAGVILYRQSASISNFHYIFPL